MAQAGELQNHAECFGQPTLLLNPVVLSVRVLEDLRGCGTRIGTKSSTVHIPSLSARLFQAATFAIAFEVGNKPHLAELRRDEQNPSPPKESAHTRILEHRAFHMGVPFKQKLYTTRLF